MTDGYASERFLPLVEAIYELLRDYPIRSEMGSVRIMAEESWREVVVVDLASGLSLTALTRAVIEWHKTLDTAAIAAERSTCGATLRLGLIGRTNDTNVEVWGEVPYDSQRTGLLIDPDQRTFVSVDDIAYWMVDGWMRGDNDDDRSDRDGGGAVAP